jgi:hypothetical protein
MNAPMLRVPAPLTGDSSDLAVTLEVAGALWDKGDSEEAIRWLKRAAEAAHQGGDASRSAALAQAAVDLEAALDSARDATTRSPAGALATPTVPSMSSQQANLPAGAATGASKLEGGMRVSVKTSARDPDLLVVRPLSEGQPPPAGTREGFLVLAEPQLEGRTHANGNGFQ